MDKPVVAFISGRTEPPGKRMGHAGAIISSGKGTPQTKVAAFEDAGVAVAEKPVRQRNDECSYRMLGAWLSSQRSSVTAYPGVDA